MASRFGAETRRSPAVVTTHMATHTHTHTHTQTHWALSRFNKPITLLFSFFYTLHTPGLVAGVALSRILDLRKSHRTISPLPA